MSDTATASLDVRLENFEGPLDLLLHLIRKNDLKISDIPIAEITQEYLSYLDVMKDLNLEVAGEFLVMASMLMQIKAHMLLPSPETEVDEGPDPRAELINKLLEYQKFKEAANYLSTAHERAKDVYYRAVPPTFEEDDFTLRASVFDLMEAFKRVLDDAPKEIGQVLRDEIPIEVKIRDILDRLVENSSIAFESLFRPETSRRERVVTFLALLELIRQKQIVARQSDLFSSIRLYRLDSVPEDVPLATEAPVVEPEPVPAPVLVEDATTESFVDVAALSTDHDTSEHMAEAVAVTVLDSSVTDAAGASAPLSVPEDVDELEPMPAPPISMSNTPVEPTMSATSFIDTLLQSQMFKTTPGQPSHEPVVESEEPTSPMEARVEPHSSPSNAPADESNLEGKPDGTE